jgi:hypothetical protein
MTSVPLDDKTLAALVADKKLVAVTNDTGKVIGYFAPALSREEMARQHLGLPDPNELRQQRDKAERTYTTAEVKAHLRSLEKQG